LNSALQTDPFFYPFNDSSLTSSSEGSTEAGNFTVQSSALAWAIPAVSFAAGRNPVNGLGQSNNFDLNVMSDRNTENAWPQSRLDGTYQNRWLHSDMKNIAYRFNYNLYNQIVEIGGLK
jgi:hypothetical protein